MSTSLPLLGTSSVPAAAKRQRIYELTEFSQPPFEVGRVLTCVFQVRKMKHSESK